MEAALGEPGGVAALLSGRPMPPVPPWAGPPAVMSAPGLSRALREAAPAAEAEALYRELLLDLHAVYAGLGAALARHARRRGNHLRRIGRCIDAAVKAAAADCDWHWGPGWRRMRPSAQAAAAAARAAEVARDGAPELVAAHCWVWLPCGGDSGDAAEALVARAVGSGTGVGGADAEGLALWRGRPEEAVLRDAVGHAVPGASGDAESRKTWAEAVRREADLALALAARLVFELDAATAGRPDLPDLAVPQAALPLLPEPMQSGGAGSKGAGRIFPAWASLASLAFLASLAALPQISVRARQRGREEAEDVGDEAVAFSRRWIPGFDGRVGDEATHPIAGDASASLAMDDPESTGLPAADDDYMMLAEERWGALEGDYDDGGGSNEEAVDPLETSSEWIQEEEEVAEEVAEEVPVHHTQQDVYHPSILRQVDDEERAMRIPKKRSPTAMID